MLLVSKNTLRRMSERKETVKLEGMWQDPGKPETDV